MRLGAVESHMKGKKHSMRLTPQSASIQGWLGQTSDGSVAASANSSLTQHSSAHSITEITIAISLPSVNTDLTIIPFVTSEQTLKPEIIWALHNTMTHQSFTSSQAANELFINMFPDSEIAKKFSCGKTKLSYLVTFGLAQYFTSELIAKLHDSSNFVILFDESFNRISKDEQMDVHVRSWDNEKQCIETRYLRSEFLGHCTASDLLKKLNEATQNLTTKKILQISMDRPNVNHKFYRDYVAMRKETDPYAPDLLEIGSCGLHVIHGAFKTGVNATGWKTYNLLRSL